MGFRDDCTRDGRRGYIRVCIPSGDFAFSGDADLHGIDRGRCSRKYDRLLHRYVIDFLYVSLIDFPVFNVADCYVVVGALLLIVLIFTLYRNDNFECLNPEKE